MSGLT